MSPISRILKTQKFHTIIPLLRKTAQDSRRWEVQNLLQQEGTVTIVFFNAHAVNTAIHFKKFRNFLFDCDYLLRDGIGTNIALHLFDFGYTKNLNGTDLIPNILEQYKSKRIAIFGTTDTVLSSCRQRLAEGGFANIIATLHGFHDESVYMEACQELCPDIVILCMGMPKQELLAARIAENKMAGMVICGGGLIFILSQSPVHHCG